MREGKKHRFRAAIDGPYRAGDLLWLRETWSPGHHGPPIYRAENPKTAAERWLPPATLPRRFARVWLRVVRVKAEQLSELDPARAAREGFESVEQARAYWRRRGGSSCYLVIEFELVSDAPPMVQLELYPSLGEE